MKKLSLLAAMVIFGAGIATAASLAIPWFVDNTAPAAGLPSDSNGVTGLVNLKNNTEETVTLTIAYFSAEGASLGPPAPDNTFTLPPLAAVAFRPVVEDPAANVQYNEGTGEWERIDDTIEEQRGGQEGPVGVAVPDRPRSVNDEALPGSDDGQGNEVVDDKKNGSITISWEGDDTDIQGQYTWFQTFNNVTMSYAHLLPPGTS